MFIQAQNVTLFRFVAAWRQQNIAWLKNGRKGTVGQPVRHSLHVRTVQICLRNAKALDLLLSTSGRFHSVLIARTWLSERRRAVVPFERSISTVLRPVSPIPAQFLSHKSLAMGRGICHGSNLWRANFGDRHSWSILVAFLLSCLQRKSTIVRSTSLLEYCGPVMLPGKVLLRWRGRIMRLCRIIKRNTVAWLLK